MNLAGFHALVKEELKRGSSLDALIPTRTGLAAKFLERNYSWQYMKHTVEVYTNPNDASPRDVTMPSDLKSVRWLRAVNDAGDYVPVRRIDPRDLQRLEIGMPGGFWHSGRTVIRLDKTPDKVYVLEGEFVFYTVWPTDTDALPWLTEQAPDLLLAQTMVLFGNYLRDIGMVQQYRGMRDEALKTAYNDDAEVMYDGMDDEMAYSPKYGFPTDGV